MSKKINDLNNKTILVTGGTSYIGKHVIAQLIEKDYSVRTTIRNKDKTDEIISDIQKYLGKEVSLEELSYVINEANEQELFCKAGVKQYTPGEFSDYVEETLKRFL